MAMSNNGESKDLHLTFNGITMADFPPIKIYAIDQILNWTDHISAVIIRALWRLDI